MIYHHVYKFWLLSLLENYGNFKEAASAAGITQSALSQNLSSLEQITQRTLVERERGFIRLTSEGEQALSKLKPILDQLAQVTLTDDCEEQMKGTLRLGAYESIAVSFLPHLFKKVRNLHPDLKIDVQTSRSDSLARQVRKGGLDIALVIDGKEDSKTHVDTIMEDELGLYISQELSYKSKELKDHVHLGLATLSSSSEGPPRYYQKFVAGFPVKFPKTMSSDSFETIRSFTLGGCIVGLLPNRVAERSAGLVKIWPNSTEESQKGLHKMTLISRKDTRKCFKDLVLNEMIKLS